MAEFDEHRKRLTVKLVYYGPAMSGKTTNLTRLHDLLSADLIGEMMTLETEGDRTLFFDLLPVGFKAPSGLLVKFKLFTVPGQVAHDGTRKAVLSRADGVIFVADSQRSQAVNNGASFENLIANANTLGIDLATLPLIVQFNKRDLPDILSEQEIHERWAKAPWPLFFASALEGGGVLDSFTALLARVHDRLDHRFSLESVHGLSRAAFVAVAGEGP
ncbi:GTP-binding protein [Noviherbaspirillum sp. Root189]|uniref:GTP-binding protein n=1 Tax=Noviherbaspirillum sp. Root189 TaxID=1736487 RepID=UPI0007107464|nr:GTPase domain-containing protein [Noviherbaspirillum sp. Root189]KRB79540.1 GTPase [Noviherbaspirillum sp. Root189]